MYVGATVESKLHTRPLLLRLGIQTAANIAKERCFKLSSMSRVATKARVLLLHSGSIYLRRYNTGRVWHIYQRTIHIYQPNPPLLYFPPFLLLLFPSSPAPLFLLSRCLSDRTTFQHAATFPPLHRVNRE